MIPKQWSKKYGKVRRISVTVLLFTFCSISALSQEPDSIIGLPDDVVLPGKGSVLDKTTLDSLKRTERLQPRRVDAPASRVSESAAESEQTPFLFLDDSINSTKILADTTGKEELKEGHSARKAMIFSMVCPGLGQAYNKKYWKIPIVYGALGGAVYAIWYNTGEYRLALDEYALDYATNGTSADDRYVKLWRRFMEMSYIALVAVDALAVVDAYVDANLFYWDVNPDLSLRLEPSIQPIFNASGAIRNNYGFKCSLTF
jgi:hypothetical protein